MSDTIFVAMYHPALGNVQVQAPLLAVPTYQSHGWLLVDPNATPPPVATPYLTQAAGDSRYLRAWLGGETLTAGAVRMTADGHIIVRTADGATRSSYDATEAALWTVVSGGSGGTVSDAAVAAQVTAGTATQAALKAAYVPFWTAGETVTAGAVRVDSTGHLITRNANGTTRPSYDTTEQALWTVVSGGAGGTAVSVDGTAVSTLNIDSTPVTAASIGADAVGAAAAAQAAAATDATSKAAAAQTAAQTYATGVAAGLALVFGA